MKHAIAPALALWMLLAAGPAPAAPVTTQAFLTVDLGFVSPFTLFGSGTVDVTGNTVTIPAGLVTQGAWIVVPLTSTALYPGFLDLSIRDLANAGGVFSVGGVDGQAPSEVCNGTPGPGEACNRGGGVGGVMSLTGTFFFRNRTFIGGIPLNVNLAAIGQGGSTNSPFSVDAAAWSTGTGSVGLSGSVVAAAGGLAPFNLVSPTYLEVGFFDVSFPILMRLTLTNVSLPVPEARLAILVGAVGLAALLWPRR